MSKRSCFRSIAGVVMVGAAAALPYAVQAAAGDAEDNLPPWTATPEDGIAFKQAPFDYVVDLYGDVVGPQLTVFFAGNQFMVVPDLIAAFRTLHPEIHRIFVETLPPGKLAEQIERGALIMGTLRIDAKPDVYATGGKTIAEMQAAHQWFTHTTDYATNKLAIMVRAGNPKQVGSVADFARADVRISMPNPAFEGIAITIESVFKKVGGNELDQAVMKTKVADGSTFLTEIHHRQSPLRILDGESDAAPVWSSEVYFQEHVLHHRIDTVEIPEADNVSVTYTAAILRKAPHPRAAKDFLAFLTTPEAQAIYRKYGFAPIRDAT